MLLATQNPVDLDYKALSNAGTWFVGKLQTERDKLRLLEGLETVAAENGTLTDRSYLETVISSLGNRIFLLHDIHRPAPLLFQSRWALSFLRGPMTKDQVSHADGAGETQNRRLRWRFRFVRTATELSAEVGDRCPHCGQPPWANAHFRKQDKAFREKLQQRPAAAVSALKAMANIPPPVLPPDVPQFFLPIKTPQAGMEIEYQPMVLGFAEVAFVVDKRRGIEYPLPIRLIAKAPGTGMPVDWDRAELSAVDWTTRRHRLWAGTTCLNRSTQGQK